MVYELKDCPFCGNIAYLDFNESDNQYFVACSWCGARTEGSDVEIVAASKWNNRADD